MSKANPELKEKLKIHVENLERIDNQIDALLETKEDLQLMAVNDGINLLVLNKLLSQRRHDKNPAMREQAEMCELYRQAIEE
tara:strand:- start:683 stop:928 length:246 start_codon:yes stop_codon:yes gene_type:complete